MKIKMEESIMEKVVRRREKIYQYILKRLGTGYSPTVREICSDLRISSTSTVHTDLRSLTEQGLIVMDEGRNRTIRLPGNAGVRVPLLGTVTAGIPILAVENIEQYIPVALTSSSDKEMFALRVRGDSMKNAAILNDDIVVVERTPTAENGEIVVALLDDEATVKRFFRENDKIRLQPENNDYTPIVTDNAEVLGKVVSVMRFY